MFYGRVDLTGKEVLKSKDLNDYSRAELKKLTEKEREWLCEDSDEENATESDGEVSPSRAMHFHKI